MTCTGSFSGRSAGQFVARGSRSVVVEFGPGAVAKVPLDATPDSWIRYESLYADAVRQCGAPVPRLFGLDTLDGRTISVWERVRGKSLWDLVIDNRIDPDDAGDVLATVHRALLSIAAPISLPLQYDRLTAKLRRIASVHGPLVQVPRHCGMRLCHGDIHPGNILIGEDGPMVIDWFDACRGEGLADIARTVALLDPDQDLAHLPGATAATVERMSARYRERMGVDPARTVGWEHWLFVNRMARTGEG